MPDVENHQVAKPNEKKYYYRHSNILSETNHAKYLGVLIDVNGSSETKPSAKRRLML